MDAPSSGAAHHSFLKRNIKMIRQSSCFHLEAARPARAAALHAVEKASKVTRVYENEMPNVRARASRACGAWSLVMPPLGG